jgi:hypothetical protein
MTPFGTSKIFKWLAPMALLLITAFTVTDLRAACKPNSASLLNQVKLISQIEGEMTLYGRAKIFKWAVPEALLSTGATFELKVTDLNASTTIYQDNTLTPGHCDPSGI